MIGNWLLCDFHIHTDISDGKLPLDEVIKLYGQNKFDVISITDHLVDKVWVEERRKNNEPPLSIEKEDFQDYLRLLSKKALYAWQKYKILLIPGAEITNNTKNYHILAIDIKDYIDPDLSVEEIVREIHEQGAIAIACHPNLKESEALLPFLHLCEEQDEYCDLFDAWEVANHYNLFNIVRIPKFNYIANSDFHEAAHLYSWKTLLMAEKNQEEIKVAIHENTKVAIYLFRKNKSNEEIYNI